MNSIAPIAGVITGNLFSKTKFGFIIITTQILIKTFTHYRYSIS